MNNKQYCLDLIKAIQERTDKEDWWSSKESIDFIKDRAGELQWELLLRGGDLSE